MYSASFRWCWITWGLTFVSKRVRHDSATKQPLELKREMWKKAVDWYVQYPHNVLKSLGSLHLSAHLLKLLPFFLHICGLMATWWLSQSGVMPAHWQWEKEDRRAGAKGFYLGQGGISIIIRIILYGVASLGSKCAGKCEQVAKVAIIWIAMTGLDQRWMIHPLGMGPLLTSNKIRILLAMDK